MEWDLLGVAGISEAADEYDCMVWPLVRLLDAGASTETICSWIESEVVDHFGVSVNREREAALAKSLTARRRSRSA
jgi:hypothetical protein